METKIEIKPARPEDREIVIDLFLKLLKFVDRFDNDILPTRKNAERMVDTVLLPAAARGEPILIAWEAVKPVGALFWAVQNLPYEVRWKTAYGYGTYIEESHRSQKIGTLLRKAGMKILKDKGVQRILGTTHLKNEVSIKANTRLGAIPFARVDYFEIK